MQTISEKLEQVYNTIHRERMQDMPMCNPAIKVQAIGFTEWKDFFAGIMLTPWFMNLMLLPRSQDFDATIKPGEKQVHAFPSGNYEFVAAEEDSLGYYLSCSLLSPVFEFKDQVTAENTASIAFKEIMTTVDSGKRKFAQAGTERTDTETNQKPLNRRDLLRSMLPTDNR